MASSRIFAIFYGASEIQPMITGRAVTGLNVRLLPQEITWH
jgi:hypothetical protein